MAQQVNIAEMPVVRDVLRQATTKIGKLTGVRVLLEVRYVKSDKPDENKMVLIKIIENAFELPWAKIISKKRSHKLVDARHAYMYFATTYLKQSLSATGKDLGFRDHTTVLHGIRKMKDFFEVGDPIIETINYIKEQLAVDEF